jgi:hypothetical protein
LFGRDIGCFITDLGGRVLLLLLLVQKVSVSSLGSEIGCSNYVPYVGLIISSRKELLYTLTLNFIGLFSPKHNSE